MITDAAWSLQTALYSALADDGDLQTILGDPARIYDAIPPDTIFPFLQIGAGQLLPYQGIAGGFEHIVRLTAFSRWGGRQECKAIAELIRIRLQNADLTLEGHKLLQARLVFEDHLRHRDPETFQGSMRYRFVTVPNSFVEAA
ncbi:MAG: DUF3168 domain-containing protein [Pseudomonadota bacterium]